MKDLYCTLVYLTLLILPNTRRTGGSNVEETSERYKIEGKITIQGFKPPGKNMVYDSAVFFRCYNNKTSCNSPECILTHDSGYKTFYDDLFKKRF